MDALEKMFDDLERDGGLFRPSQFWRHYNERNVAQLQSDGIENIKRTVATNYFTWIVGWRNRQFRNLVVKTHPADWPKILRNLPSGDGGSGLNRRTFIVLTILTRMLYFFVKRRDPLDILSRVSEPDYGNPFPVMLDDRIISQDLLNSVLEFYAAIEGMKINFDAPVRICEIGAGYGRNAYVFLSLFPNCTYTIIDIPPALYVAQSYLSHVCASREIQRYGEQKASASVRFLLPQQLYDLADDSFDLMLNISSFHEMKGEQVVEYLSQVDRLLSGRFYMKQWKSWHNPIDNIVVDQSSYAIKDNWRKIYSREHPAQPDFFEAAYEV